MADQQVNAGDENVLADRSAIISDIAERSQRLVAEFLSRQNTDGGEA